MAVLVDEPVAGGAALDGPAGLELGDGRAVGWLLVEAAVGAVAVVVIEVVAEEPVEVAAVPDEGAVEEFAAVSPVTFPVGIPRNLVADAPSWFAVAAPDSALIG